MEINITSPGKHWFNREAVLVNGVQFDNNTFEVKKPSGIDKDFIFKPSPDMKRFEADMLYYTKKTEYIFLNNVLNICEYYNLQYSEIEGLIERKAGFIPGWINEYLEYLGNPKKSINLHTMRIKAAILDELTGLNNGTGINLFVPSVLYFNFGLTYSIDEILYIAPEYVKKDICREVNNIKIAEVELCAKQIYSRNRTRKTVKSNLNVYKEHLLDIPE